MCGKILRNFNMNIINILKLIYMNLRNVKKKKTSLTSNNKD